MSEITSRAAGMDDFPSVERYKIESAEQWRAKIQELPWIPFPAGWRVRVIPPFSGAIARFQVSKEGFTETVSVYADFYNALGYYCDAEGNPKPYWEVYPLDGDVGRCDIGDVTELLRMISESLSDSPQSTAEEPPQT